MGLLSKAKEWVKRRKLPKDERDLDSFRVAYRESIRKGSDTDRLVARAAFKEAIRLERQSRRDRPTQAK